MKKTMLGLIVLLVSAGAQGAHPAGLVEVAHELDRAATWTYRNIASRSGPFGHDHRRHAARNLMRSADHFHRQVERGVPLPLLSRDFQRLERDYRDLQRQVGWQGHHRRGVFGNFAGHDLHRIGRLIHQTYRTLAAEQQRWGHRRGYPRDRRGWR